MQTTTKSILSIICCLLIPVATAQAAAIDDYHAAVNDAPWYDTQDLAACVAGGSNAAGASPAETKARMKVIWDLLTAPGRLTPAQAAGVMANLKVESGFDPTIVEGGSHKDSPVGVSGGYGIVQWTPGTKMLKYADLAANPELAGNLTRQVNLLWDQLTNASSPLQEVAAGKALLATSTPEEAAAAFMLKYERPKDQSASAVARRAALAAPILAEMGGGASTTVINVADTTTATSADGCAPTTTTPAGAGCGTLTTQALAQAIVDNDKINKFGRLVAEDLSSAAAGQVSSNKVKLSHSLLCIIYSVGQKHDITITSLEGGGSGHSATSLHYVGQAVDFDGFDGSGTNGRDAASIELIKAIVATPGVNFDGARFGQSQCAGQPLPTLPSGAGDFADSCDHVHFQLTRTAP